MIWLPPILNDSLQLAYDSLRLACGVVLIPGPSCRWRCWVFGSAEQRAAPRPRHERKNFWPHFVPCGHPLSYRRSA
jgi:hypothetical protein